MNLLKFTKNSKITRLKAVIIIVSVALILAVAVILRSAPGSLTGLLTVSELGSTEGRRQYLSKLGWETEPGSEEERLVLIPKTLGGVIADYADMQTSQGYDFASYRGLECRQYTYIVTNYPSSDTVYVTMFIKNGRLIGGDIHSAAIDGFMHGIR